MSKIYGIPVATPICPSNTGGGTGGGSVTDVQIANAVSNYMAENPIDVGVKTVNGNQPDENGNVNVEGGSGVNSWNDLTDKPFGDGVLYEWKESTVYTETVTPPYGAPFELIEKISTDVPGYEFLINKTCSVEYEDDTGVAYATKYITADEIAIDTIADGYYMLECLRPSEYVSVTLLFCMSDSVNFMGLTLSKGVWAMGGANKSAFGVATLVITVTDVSCIDEKYIPDTIARTADVQTMINNSLGVIENGTY